MTANNAYPIELVHSVASHICVFMFDNVSFHEHLGINFKLFSNNAKGYI